MSDSDSDYMVRQSLDLCCSMLMVVNVCNQCLRRSECLNVGLDQFYVFDCQFIAGLPDFLKPQPHVESSPNAPSFHSSYVAQK